MAAVGDLNRHIKTNGLISIIRRALQIPAVEQVNKHTIETFIRLGTYHENRIDLYRERAAVIKINVVHVAHLPSHACAPSVTSLKKSSRKRPGDLIKPRRKSALPCRPH